MPNGQSMVGTYWNTYSSATVTSDKENSILPDLSSWQFLPPVVWAAWT